MGKHLLLSACAALGLSCDATPKTYGPVYDGGRDADEVDAAADVMSDTDASADGSSDATACGSTVALLGGSATSLFGAAGPGGSALSATSLPGALLDCAATYGCADPIAIAPVGKGLLAVLATSGGSLASTTFSSSWADPAGITNAATIDGPALATIGGAAHLLYQDANYKYFHAQYTGSAWDSATDPVGGSGPSQSYGARGPGAAAAATDLVMVQAGADEYLYDQTWNGSWQTAHKQGAAGAQNTVPPTITALSGGASELLAAYVRVNDYKVMAVARSGGTWGTPMLIDTNAYSNDPLAVTALPGGKALIVFRGSDEKPYFTKWDGASTWSTPAAVVVANNPTIATAPSVAPGVCGADAIAAWAESGGGVKLAMFSGGGFGAPQAVSGTNGARFVAVGTLR